MYFLFLNPESDFHKKPEGVKAIFLQTPRGSDDERVKPSSNMFFAIDPYDLKFYSYSFTEDRNKSVGRTFNISVKRTDGIDSATYYLGRGRVVAADGDLRVVYTKKTDEEAGYFLVFSPEGVHVLQNNFLLHLSDIRIEEGNLIVEGKDSWYDDAWMVYEPVERALEYGNR